MQRYGLHSRLAGSNVHVHKIGDSLPKLDSYE